VNEGVERPFRSRLEVEELFEGEDLALDDGWRVFGWEDEWKRGGSELEERGRAREDGRKRTKREERKAEAQRTHSLRSRIDGTAKLIDQKDPSIVPERLGRTLIRPKKGRDGNSSQFSLSRSQSSTRPFVHRAADRLTSLHLLLPTHKLALSQHLPPLMPGREVGKVGFDLLLCVSEFGVARMRDGGGGETEGGEDDATVVPGVDCRTKPRTCQ